MADTDIMILAKDVDYKKMVGKVCYLSEKIDGIPGIFDAANPAALSRGGNHILSVPHIHEAVRDIIATTFDPEDEVEPPVILGELYVPGKPFKDGGGIIRRQEPQVNEGIKLRIWDAYFPSNMKLGYQARMVKAHPWLQDLERKYPELVETSAIHWVVPKSAFHAEKAVLTFFNNLIDVNDYKRLPRPEGVIIRTHDEPYKIGRSWGLMRYVEKPTIDLRVCAFEEATANKTMTFMGETFNKGEGLRAVGKIFVKYGEDIIGVGPGCMTHKERCDYFNRPEKLVGKIIKIQYKRDDSYKALRQPTFVCIHHDKTTPDK